MQFGLKERIQPGSFVYVEGVASYQTRHPYGNAGGWWCLVTANNPSSGQIMLRPCLYKSDCEISECELNAKLVKYYNAPSSILPAAKNPRAKGILVQSEVRFRDGIWDLLLKPPQVIYTARMEQSNRLLEQREALITAQKRPEDSQRLQALELDQYLLTSDAFNTHKTTILTTMGVNVEKAEYTPEGVKVEIDFRALAGNRRTLGLDTVRFERKEKNLHDFKEKMAYAKRIVPTATVKEKTEGGRTYMYMTFPSCSHEKDRLKFLEKPWDRLEAAIKTVQAHCGGRLTQNAFTAYKKGSRDVTQLEQELAAAKVRKDDAARKLFSSASTPG